MRKLTFIAFLCTLLLISCNQEEYSEASSTSNQSGIVFKLQKEGYEGKEYDVDVIIDTFVIPDLTFTLVLPEGFDDSLQKLYAVWTLSNTEGDVFKIDWENAFVLNRTGINDFKLLIDADNLTGNHDRLDIGEWRLNITVADTNDTDAQKMVGSGDIKVNIIPAGDPVEEDVEISLSE